MRLLQTLLLLLLLSACSALPPGSVEEAANVAPTPSLPAVLTPVLAATLRPVTAPPNPTLPIGPVPTPTVLPTPSPAPALRVAVIGDYGMAGAPAQAVASLVRSWQPDYIVTTGDNNYPDGAAETIDANIGQYYQEFIAPYQGSYGSGATENRFFPVLGNHDWNTPGARPYLDYFTLPGNERYYSVVLGPLRVFALSSHLDEPDGVSSDSTQAEWLRQELATATECWKLVVMHHAPFSSGWHGGSVWMQWPFAEWGADAVLAGHDHHYERIMRDGVPYIVNGLGGAARYRLGIPVEGSAVRFNAEHGALLLEATPNRLTFEFVSVAGEVVDRYTLEQNCQ